MVFDPFEPNAQPIVHTLSDDLADIYCDINEGLLEIGNQAPVSSGTIWEWKFGLEIHWGRHAVNAISALHALLFGEFAVK